MRAGSIRGEICTAWRWRRDPGCKWRSWCRGQRCSCTCSRRRRVNSSTRWWWRPRWGCWWRRRPTSTDETREARWKKIKAVIFNSNWMVLPVNWAEFSWGQYTHASLLSYVREYRPFILIRLVKIMSLCSSSWITRSYSYRVRRPDRPRAILLLD